MLSELRIDNFAIIQHLELDLKDGLVTFTGETGAGKSIILDAILALMGGKTDPTFIRAGSERAQVEGIFHLSDANRSAVHALLEAEDLLEDDHDTITLGRELRREGRTVARINGRSVGTNLLRDVGSYLVDIHGQSEHLSLLNVRQHLGLLDRYASITALHQVYHEAYKKLTTLRRELAALRANEQDAIRRADLLTFQANEIDSAHLIPGEEDDLRGERNRLANAENLASLAQQSILLLDEGTPEAPSITDQVGQVVQALASLSKIDSEQAGLYEQSSTLADSLSEISRDLRDYLEKIEFNPRRLEQVEERLELIHNLKRKYGGSVEAVIAFAKDARSRLDLIAHAGERIGELEAEEQKVIPVLAKAALALSERRKQAAASLSRAIETELDDLRMAGAHFSVDFQVKPEVGGLPLPDGQVVDFDDSGIDKAEFLIAPNPGEGLKPLVKIASGGETSRLMLALKNVLARADAIPTLIFDEIDQGIGGRVGSVVGEKLWTLGRQHQVLVVTHLPQLAAFGDQHFRVAKNVVDGRTLTEVNLMEDEPRLDELAQMFGSLTEANRHAAREALDAARLRAKELTS